MNRPIAIVLFSLLLITLMAPNATASGITCTAVDHEFSPDAYRNGDPVYEDESTGPTTTKIVVGANEQTTMTITATTTCTMAMAACVVGVVVDRPFNMGYEAEPVRTVLQTLGLYDEYEDLRGPGGPPKVEQLKACLV